MNTDATSETWTTTTIAIQTPRGERFQGVSFVGVGRPTYGPLPRKAQVRYTTRLLKSHIEAGEQARGRTIHHNLWHDGSEDAARIASMHQASDCRER